MNKIMIIEDDPDFRRTLLILLTQRFPALVLKEAGSGEEAIEEIQSFSPDLVLTDIRLPGENGLRLTQKIRMKYPHMPIIVLTSYYDIEYEEAAYAAGATRFASKHETSAEEIICIVGNLLFNPLINSETGNFSERPIKQD
jgi:DNA-binding NarL/FixJ family response regulator